uniref:citrate lyase subunit alpha n=1 Tax=Pedobacter sp. TaxID=1411316 RepID=UPI003D7F3F56
LMDAAKNSGAPVYTIEELRDIAYSITGTPAPVQFGERVVGIVEARDGSVIDVVRQIKEFEFK